MPVSYEYVVETLDWYEGCGDDPDIIDTNAFDKLDDAERYATLCDEPWRIALRRDYGNDIEGLLTRFYAYPDETGKLPEIMETATGYADGPNVPNRFRNVVIPTDKRKG